MEQKNLSELRYADRRLNFLEKKQTVARIRIIATIAMRTDISRRDIPKIIKFKATNSLRVSCLFVSLSIPPKNGLTAKTGVIKNKNTW